MIFPRCFLKPDAFLERMIVMKKMRKLLALLAAGVLALCSLSVSASAETITIVGVDGEINTEPVYALGKDLSLYPKGDADLDGEVTAYDACVILWNTACFICGFPDVLTEDQIQVANVDVESNSRDKLTNRVSLLSVSEARDVLVYVTLHSAGFDDITMEDVVTNNY